MSAMEAELDGMVGRLHIEVQAIVGFARLAQGDLFEVSLKHGSQKWKTRGKTQPDRTQRWDSNNHNFTCYPDQLLIIKVSEVRMIKSKVLSERSFDTTKFITPQPLLVTMNLNAIGSLKLKLVVSWLPLITSKTISQPIDESKKQLEYQANNSSLMTASTISAPNQTLTEDRNGYANFSDKGGTISSMSPPKICLREKKRSSRKNVPDESNFEKNWRSSTTILDSIYKDLSKSIPAIDDLTAFGNQNSHKQNVHRQMLSESGAGNSDFVPQRSQQPPIMGTKGLCNEGKNDQRWLRSISMHHLSAKNDEENGNKAANCVPKTRSSVYCGQSITNSNETPSPNVMELRGRQSADSDDSSGVSSLGAHGSVGKGANKLQSCERADTLLKLIDRLRISIGPLRQNEYPELAAFEAAMLNWEASLKLNRALFVENSRAGTNSSRRNTNNSNRLMKRASLYSVQQHSPPSTLSSEDANESNLSRGNSRGDQMFEHDSGIDSLRQQVSPYNRQRMFNGTATNGSLFMNGTAGRCSNNSVAVGPAQRRFNKHLQERRRRSLGGWILDDPVECERWLPALNGNVEQQNGQFLKHDGQIQAATGHPELDLCLQHHLSNALNDLEELTQINGPLECRTNELLNRLEQNTVALEEMIRIGDALPAWPNVTNLLSDLGADWDQQEVWLSTCYSQNASIIVPAERLRTNLQAVVSPIVKKAQYPQLVNRVVDNLMEILQNTPSDSQKTIHKSCVSIFEFGALFAGKQFGTYIVNLAHEAFITTSLESQNKGTVREIMERLRLVPILPPLNALRHIALVLQGADSDTAIAIERYFRSASNELENDLSISFINLLESKDPKTRSGSCKALGLLKNEQCMEALSYLANEDPNQMVRVEAKRAFERIHRFFDEYQEITKI